MIISAPGKEKSQTVILKQDRKSSTVVEHSLHHPVFEDSKSCRHLDGVNVKKLFLNRANDSITEVEYSLHYPVVEGLSPDDDVGT